MDDQIIKHGGPIPEWPYITPELAGVGGEIKLSPDHFVVREIPLYQPCGEGRHLYLNLTRASMNTHAVVDQLADLFAVDSSQIGLAGLKDKQATTTQTFSLPAEGLTPESAAERLAEGPLTLNWSGLHTNKLKRGHLLGNHFTIVVVGVADGAAEQAARIAEALTERGLPNFFGVQRFGASGDNAAKGRRILGGQGKARGWLAGLMLSAYQSLLFNLWLAMRMERGWFDQLLVGDIAKKYETGGMFGVEDAAVDTARLAAGEISHTGPIFGYKARLADGEPGELEASILAASEIDTRDFKRCRLKGSRRPGRLLLGEINISDHPEGLSFSFALPKGSYATVLLREFMKIEPDLPE